MDRHSDATEEIGDGAANVAKRLEKTQSCLIKKKEAKKRAKERKDAGAIVVVNLCTEERAEGESEKEKDVEKKNQHSTIKPRSVARWKRPEYETRQKLCKKT